MAGGSRLNAAALRTLVQESWKYLLVSLVALGADTALLVAMKDVVGLPLWLAVAAGFMAGVMINYGLSVAFVFHEHRLGHRGIEFLGFLAIGLIGLAVKEGVIEGLVAIVGLNYKIANIPAVGAAFVFNFAVRRALLFSRPDGAGLSAGSDRKADHV